MVTRKSGEEFLISRPTWKTDIIPTPGLEVSIGWDADAPVVLAPLNQE